MRHEFSKEVLKKGFKNRIAEKHPVIFAAAGSGLVARMYDISKVDAIVATGIGDFVQNGFPSAMGHMFYGDANKLNQKVTNMVTMRVRDTPVIAGVGATDPFRNQTVMLEDLIKKGVAGIVNMPTVCVYDELRRAQLQSGKFGYEQEVQLIKEASGMGLLTVANVANAQDAHRMVEAGADVLVVICGFTVGGLAGADAVTAMSMKEVTEKVQEVVETVKNLGSDAVVLATGGLLNKPEAVEALFKMTDVEGFLGGSAFERIPIEKNVAQAVYAYQELTTRP